MLPLSLDVSLNLMLAVIASSEAPLLLLKGDLTVVAASRSFSKVFRIDPKTIPNRPFHELGEGEWNIPQLVALFKATASGFAETEAYEVDLRRKGGEKRRLVVNVHKLEYGDDKNVMLLVSVTDVTDARSAQKLKDDKLAETATLLQELQHRVANSLQIIASVLMQSARKVQSDETRGHLYNAHHRLMSVATLQQQLAASTVGDVKLRPYFTSLCDSIAASMIRDPDKLALRVVVDDTSTSSDVSISLGLIITELVINALKHAFPEDRVGEIDVAYRSEGGTWTLSVTDNGIGMPPDGIESRAGLGTSIVRALSRQLNADIRISDANPGTAVSIRSQSAASELDENTVLESAV